MGTMDITQLPTDVLRHIFAATGDGPDAADFRRQVLPLVCKPFAAAIAGPSPLWARLAINADAHKSATGTRLRWAKARKWTVARAAGVRTLQLTPGHAAPAGGLAPLWRAFGGGLKHLDLALERVLSETRPNDDLAELRRLTSLETLRLSGPAAPSCRVSTALAQGLAPLTQLKELALSLQACPFTMLRPELPAVLLGALVNLRMLDLDLASFAPPAPPPCTPDEAGDYEDDDQPRTPKSAIRGGNMLPACITRLTQLEELRLAGDWRRPKVMLPEGFGELPVLRALTLATLELATPGASPSGFTPAPPPAPPALERLVFEDCTGDFPFGSRLAGLRVMRLEGCDEMHMAAAALQALREAKDMAATVVIRDASLETPPHFLDSLPANVRLTAKPSRAAAV